jgi:hypothetical protein
MKPQVKTFSQFLNESEFHQSFPNTPELGDSSEFDRIFNEIFSMEPEYRYRETSSNTLSRRYNRRRVSDGEAIATLNNDELGIQLIITYTNYWEEDPDGASYHGTLSMGYEHWNDSGNDKLDDLLARFSQEELVQNPGTGVGGISIEQVKSRDIINSEFMSLLSDETREMVYGQIEGVLIEHDKNQYHSDDY